jgi:hypothetical protein
MRTSEVFGALDYLSAQAKTKWPFEQFKEGLDREEGEGRWQILRVFTQRVV